MKELLDFCNVSKTVSSALFWKVPGSRKVSNPAKEVLGGLAKIVAKTLSKKVFGEFSLRVLPLWQDFELSGSVKPSICTL